MVAKRKKYLITTERREIFIVRRNKTETIRGFCAECKSEVGLLTLDAVTSQTGKRTRELLLLIEENLVHSIETTTGHLLVCLTSLDRIDQPKLTDKFYEKE